MIFAKFLYVSVLLALGQLIWAGDALAWGPGVHTVIALKLLDDVRLILPSIAGIITSHPLEYLYGCLAADFFVGKSIMKKSTHAHNWHAGFQFLREAIDDHEAAYAYGFLSHLAADVIAHNFFVPNLISSYRAGKKKSHLYWEIKADYLVGPEYTKIARDVLSTEHRACDKILRTISGRKKNGLKATKLIFTQSVRISGHAYKTHHMFFQARMVGRHGFQEYTAFMVALSSRTVKSFLKHPETSPCLARDPIGIRNLSIAKSNRSLTRFFSPLRPVRSFIFDQELFKL